KQAARTAASPSATTSERPRAELRRPAESGPTSPGAWWRELSSLAEAALPEPAGECSPAWAAAEPSLRIGRGGRDRSGVRFGSRRDRGAPRRPDGHKDRR